MTFKPAAVLTIALLSGAPAWAQSQPLSEARLSAANTADVSKDAMRKGKTACALEWQQRKLDGKIGSLLWREFHSQCHARWRDRDIMVSPKK